MVTTALQHMVLAILGLRGSARALPLFRDVLILSYSLAFSANLTDIMTICVEGQRLVTRLGSLKTLPAKVLERQGQCTLHAAYGVPRDLRKHYTTCTQAARQPKSASHTQKVISRMLESVRVDTRGMRHTTARVSSSIFSRYKNAEKCMLLLNAVRINASD